MLRLIKSNWCSPHTRILLSGLYMFPVFCCIFIAYFHWCIILTKKLDIILIVNSFYISFYVHISVFGLFLNLFLSPFRVFHSFINTSLQSSVRSLFQSFGYWLAFVVNKWSPNYWMTNNLIIGYILSYLVFFIISTFTHIVPPFSLKLC